MPASIGGRKRIAYVLTEARLKHLSDILASLGAVSWEVRFENGLQVDYESVDEVLAIRNTRDQAVSRIEADAHGSDIRATTVLSGADNSTFAWGVTGKTPELIKPTHDAMAEWAQEARIWYTPIARDDFSLVGLIASFAIVLLPLALAKNYPRAAIATAIGAAATLLFTAIRHRWFFPRVVFAFGYGKDRQEVFQTRRRSLFGLLVGGVLLKLVYDRFLK